MGFAADLQKLCDKAQGKMELVVRKTALQLQSSMISMSPVDTGRFRGNWQCGIGQKNTSTGDAPNSDALGRTAQALPAWKPGQMIWLTNSLPYSYRLEHGWSKQSPGGMVRLTIQSYTEALAKAVASTK
jgi:hypothetical protein